MIFRGLKPRLVLFKSAFADSQPAKAGLNRRVPSGCGTSVHGPKQKANAMFFHAVYFYPTEDGTPADAKTLAAGCRKWLASIPGVAFFDVGLPAMTPRDMVDNAYAVALLVGYENVEAHDIYQDHPDHLSFIAENKHLWSKVVVFDSLSA